MRRFVLAAVLLLALPGVAQAKEITGLTLCGPAGCEQTKLEDFGHRGPVQYSNSGLPGPPPTSFYRLMFGVDGHVDSSNAIYYEPTSGLVAFDSTGVASWMKWFRLEPAVASAAKDLARRLEPFPRPVVTEVKIGKQVLREDAASYLRLFDLDGRLVEGKGRAVGIRFVSEVESPWTENGVLYYPANDVLLVNPAHAVRLPAALAADVEAARPLGSGGKDADGFPWAIVVGALGILAATTILVRRR